LLPIEAFCAIFLTPPTLPYLISSPPPSLRFSKKLLKMAGIAFGSFNDSVSFASIKAYIAEFISTLLFVFAGVGSAIAYG